MQAFFSVKRFLEPDCEETPAALGSHAKAGSEEDRHGKMQMLRVGLWSAAASDCHPNSRQT